MNEFYSLKWDTSEKSYLEKQVCTFVSDESLLGSHVYTHLRKSLEKPPELQLLTYEVNFVPGGKYTHKFSKKSLLTRIEQDQCLSAMKILMLNKPPHLLKQIESTNIEVFKSLKYKISLEHKIFNELVKDAWEQDKKFIAKVKNKLYKYAFLLTKRKARRYLDYKRYYKEEDLINMNYIENNGAIVEVNCIGNLLEVGTLARFSHPSLKLECRLSPNTLPCIKSLRKYSKLTVSRDLNIRELLKNHEFDVVISSSGLKRILDNSDLREKWTIPIIVETVKISSGTEVHCKKVVFIDKPFVKNHPDPIDLKYCSMKRLVRTNFCHYEAFTFENQEICFEEKKVGLDEQSETEKFKGTEDNEVDFPWKKQAGENDIIHHNVSYRLWKFQKNVNNFTLMKNQSKNTELRLLVRSKLDACEDLEGQALQPVIVTPKIELQLKYGANIPTKSELSREWTSLFFRPFSNLYRVRMHWKSAEVVKLEKCLIQKVANEASLLYDYKPYLGLGVLNDVLTKLIELKEGNYVLAHLPKHGNFVGLYKECESSPSIDLHSEYNEWNIRNYVDKTWIPIDLNFILPIHEMQNRPPGFFTPFIKGKAGKRIKKKKTKKSISS